MTALSVVVADVGGDLDGALVALARELDADTDEIVGVTERAGGMPSGGRVPLLRVPAPGRDRGGRYAAGLAASRGDVVAFTDSATRVVPGWRRALLDAVAGGAVVVGGPVGLRVVPGARGHAITWAGYLLEYGPHGAPPYRSATGDVSANNVAYDGATLRHHARGAVWKTELHRALAAAGIRPVVADGMRVEVVRRYRWRDVAGRRADGARYARALASGWPRRRRWWIAARDVALPAVMVIRAVRAARRIGRPVSPASGLVLCAGAVAWTVGEVAGLLDRHEHRTRDRGLPAAR